MISSAVVLILSSLAVVLAGCGSDGRSQGQQQEPAGTGRGADEVSVGGFSVGDRGGGESPVPQVSVERQDVREYLNQVRPILEDTTPDVSDLVQPEVRVEDGQLSLDLGLEKLKEVREDVRGGLERLRGVQPPEGLDPIHERLISNYEEVLPAYDSVIDAVESGDPGQLSSAARESLPRMERFDDEVSGILQDLRRAAGDG